MGFLIDLLKGSMKGIKFGLFEWLDNAEDAFIRLRDVFINAPLLKHFDFNLPIRIEIDALEFALVCILI